MDDANSVRDLSRAVLDATVDGVLVVDLEGRIVHANTSAVRMFLGPDADAEGGAALVGRAVHDFVPDDSRARHARHVSGFTGDDTRIMGRGRELGAQRADGSRFPVEVTLTPLPPAGRPLVCAVVRDITERVEMNRRLTFLSLHDPLTGLGNRVQLDDRLRQALARRVRRGGHVAVLLLDLDRFKAVNDSLGHAAGDDLLRQVAARMLASVRPEDSVVRLGGDEFVVMCEVAAPDQGRLVAERVLERLEAPFRLGPVEVFVGASIGVAVSPGSGEPGAEDAQRLLGDADLALYAAKADGRGRVQVYDPTMRAAAEGRLALASDLHRALERGEVDVAFERVVDVATGAVVAVRARPRWTHPRAGTVPAAQMRALAEDSDLLVEMDLRTLTQGCRAVADVGRPVEVWVGLSTRALAGTGVVDAVRAALEGSGLPASRLVVEVHESTLGVDAPGVVATLLALRDLGTGVAVDDVGSGPTRLSGLATTPLTAVEVAASLVTGRGGADEGRARRALTEAIVGFGHALGLVTVACGVTGPADLGAVRSVGCERATGPLWGPPLPAAHLARALGEAGGVRGAGDDKVDAS